MTKNYTPEFKAKVVMELFREELTLTQLAAGYGIHPNLVSKWKTAAVERLPELLADRRKRDKAVNEQEERTKDLYAQISELTTKLAWLKKNLASTFSRSQRLDIPEPNGNFSIAQQCELLSLNRTSLYYKPHPIGPTKLAVFTHQTRPSPTHENRPNRNIPESRRGCFLNKGAKNTYLLDNGYAHVHTSTIAKKPINTSKKLKQTPNFKCLLFLF